MARGAKAWTRIGVLVAVVALAGCDILTPGQSRSEVPAWISASGVLLEPGESFAMQVRSYVHGVGSVTFPRREYERPLNTPMEVSWSSSDPDVAEIAQNGVVRARAEGRAVITVRVNGSVDTATVYVATSLPIVEDLRTVHRGLELSCGLDAAGRAHCWGMETIGSLGRGTIRPFQRSPVAGAVVGSPVFLDLSVGHGGACGLTSGGRAYCWGDNMWGALGDGRSWPSYPETPGVQGSAVPGPVSGGLTFRQVVRGHQHACGLDPSGVAHCWGWNHVGQLGRGAPDWSEAHVPWGLPTAGPVDAPEPFERLEAGGALTCGLTAAGRAFCWGHLRLTPTSQPLPDGCAPGGCPVPILVETEARFARLAIAAHHACGLTPEGEVHCWGDAGAGESGAPTGARVPAPRRVAGLPTMSDITVGDGFSCGLATDGTAYCWGGNVFGQLGRGTWDMDAHPEPRPVAGGLRFRSLSAGRRVACGVSVDGPTYCWGEERAGELGNGRVAPADATHIPFVTTPTPVFRIPD
jgi:alpha-tubulin suppressor-like RCC1 family protein